MPSSSEPPTVAVVVFFYDTHNLAHRQHEGGAA